MGSRLSIKRVAEFVEVPPAPWTRPSLGSPTSLWLTHKTKWMERSPSAKVNARYVMQCDISTDPSPNRAAELTALIKEQAVALVEEMSKKKKKKKRYAVESNQESDNDGSNDEESDNEDGDTNKDQDGKGDSNEESEDDGSPYAWIGKWIQKPKGERCRKSKGNRPGFTTDFLLKRAKITKEQYSRYKVCLQFPFGHTTDSPQRTAHQLIGRYLDITKSFRTNRDNHPDSWALIIDKVCPVLFCFVLFCFVSFNFYFYFYWLGECTIHRSTSRCCV